METTNFDLELLSIQLRDRCPSLSKIYILWDYTPEGTIYEHTFSISRYDGRNKKDVLDLYNTSTIQDIERDIVEYMCDEIEEEDVYTVLSEAVYEDNPHKFRVFPDEISALNVMKARIQNTIEDRLNRINF